MPEVSVLTVTKRHGWEETAKESLARQTFQDFEWIVIAEEPVDVPHEIAPEKTRKYNLNRSLNAGLRKCNGDFVIFYQDFIELEDDCFEKLVEAADDNTFVTTLTKQADGSKEPRDLDVGQLRPCIPAEWEANVSIAPMKALRELGGFDEEYDDRWSWDNVNIADRAAILGYQFKLDESNRPQLLHHKKEGGETNAEFHYWKLDQIAKGTIPIKLDYLLK